MGVAVGPHDVAARGNFCTVDAQGLITDRRAGRIATDKSSAIVARLAQIKINGIAIEVKPVKEHRFVVVFRGAGLLPDLTDTDPQKVGAAPLPVRARQPDAQRTADIVNQWISGARTLLKDEPQANALTLRGFSADPNLPKFGDIYKLKAACIAAYPMYRGVAQLVGMAVQQFSGDKPEDEFNHLKQIWNDYDFFFIHIKYTDSRGEDGNFEAKVAVIEAVDAALPIVLDLQPDVLVVTGDHCTPSRLKSHSWHPSPVLLWAPATHLPDRANEFGERACMSGGLGHVPATELMPLALAHAQRLEKYGA